MSKISISVALFAIALMIISPVQALPTTEPQFSNRTDYTISPRQLISLARQGRFKTQGIPSHNNFRQGVRTGKITAQTLVETAIADKRLPANVRGDSNYLETVGNHLKSGGCGL